MQNIPNECDIEQLVNMAFCILLWITYRRVCTQ